MRSRKTKTSGWVENSNSYLIITLKLGAYRSPWQVPLGVQLSEGGRFKILREDRGEDGRIGEHKGGERSKVSTYKANTKLSFKRKH